MVQVSKAARTVLCDSLVDASMPEETGYRLAANETGYRLKLDRPSRHDRVERIQDQVVFMVEPEIDRVLEDVLLDVKEENPKDLTLKQL